MLVLNCEIYLSACETSDYSTECSKKCLQVSHTKCFTYKYQTKINCVNADQAGVLWEGETYTNQSDPMWKKTVTW